MKKIALGLSGALLLGSMALGSLVAAAPDASLGLNSVQPATGSTSSTTLPMVIKNVLNAFFCFL